MLRLKRGRDDGVFLGRKLWNDTDRAGRGGGKGLLGVLLQGSRTPPPRPQDNMQVLHYLALLGPTVGKGGWHAETKLTEKPEKS